MEIGKGVLDFGLFIEVWVIDYLIIDIEID